ncbi:MAG: UDP-N-acetylmuramate--L-alanine ligase [Proteobacteria bacterium]|nr:UDP-N-acetylmuramate--L-alanine ligase [Pseudomonadota bacterium]
MQSPWNFSKLDQNRPVHLAGIAGSAMSGLAIILRERGFHVVGTDPRASDARERFQRVGIEIHAEQDGRHLPANTQIVIATAAIPHNHPELQAASKLGIPVITYAQALGGLMAEARGVAVAGTHGKTTTTAMIVSCLKSAGIDPGFVIGGFVPGLGASADRGQAPIFIAEACEYNRSFLNLSPEIAVITNIEEDHLDIYGNLAEIKKAFFAFTSRIPANGVLIHSANCQNTASIVDQILCQTVSFGVETEADYAAQNIRADTHETIFDLHCRENPVQEIHLPAPGRHNVANALAALAVCRKLDLSVKKTAHGLHSFQGVSRRFDIRGDSGGVIVVDDYAHHPTEIGALLEGARERYPNRRLIVAFQPHQSSRTRQFIDRFAQAFNGADLVVVSDIYSVRETDEEKKMVHSSELVEKICAQGMRATYMGEIDEAVDYLSGILQENDLLLTVGAGDVDRIAESILTRLG